MARVTISEIFVVIGDIIQTNTAAVEILFLFINSGRFAWSRSLEHIFVGLKKKKSVSGAGTCAAMLEVGTASFLLFSLVNKL